MKTLIAMRNDLIEWIKIRALSNLKSNIIVKFVWKNIICRFKYFESAMMNKKFENKVIIKQLMNRCKIKIKINLTYYLMNNKIIERKHRSIINILSKMIKNKIKLWFQHFYTILWADRIIVRDFIDIISFQFLYEYDAILLIEIKYST